MSKFKLKNLIRAIFKKEFKLNVNDQINNNNNHNISEKKISDKKYKIKIITSYDEGYSEVGNKTKETFKKYAEIQGYNFENITMPNSGRPPAWNKIRILMDEMIKKEFEFLMWIDADAFFNNYNIDIATDQSLRDFIATLMHEMVHVLQWERGSWKGEGEREATQLQYELADDFWRCGNV